MKTKAVKDEHFEAILEGLDEVRRWVRGEDVPGLRIHHFDTEAVPAIRARSGLTQAEFSAQIGVSVATLRNWEQGRRQPEGPARILLATIARDPDIVAKTLKRKAA